MKIKYKKIPVKSIKIENRKNGYIKIFKNNLTFNRKYGKVIAVK